MRTLPLCVLAAALPLSVAEPGQPPRGVVVEEVRPEGTAARTDIRPDDVLIAWSRTPGRSATAPLGGEFDSPFDLWQVEFEDGLRHETVVLAERDGELLYVTIPAGRWVVRVRPRLPERWTEALRRLPQAEDGSAASELVYLARTAAEAGDDLRSAWTLMQVALRAPVEHAEGIAQVWEAAAEVIESDPMAWAWAREMFGHADKRRGNLDEAESHSLRR